MRRIGIQLLVVTFALLPSLSTRSFGQYITGYTGNWSNVSGQPIDFYLSGASEENAELTVYDVLSVPQTRFNVDLERQSFAPENREPWKNGYGWDPTTVDLPALASGLYYLNGPNVGADYIPFIVTEPERQTDIVLVYPTNTVNAYSRSPNFNDAYPSSVNLYSVGTDGVRPESVSFLRPQNAKVYVTAGIDRWLRRQDDVSYKYISDADLESSDVLDGAKLVIVAGHSEYWTERARRNFDSHVDDGGSALVISGNTMYRRVEYDDSSNPTELRFWPRLSYTDNDYPTWESIGVDFLSAGFGPAFQNGFTGETIEMPYDGYKFLDTSKSYFEGTDVEPGDILKFPSSEFDGVPHLSVDSVTGPVMNEELLGFYSYDIIAFENTLLGTTPTAGTWVDFRETADSGRVINTAANTWSIFPARPDKDLQVTLTENMIYTLLVAEADFDEDEKLTANDIDLLISKTKNIGPARGRFDIDHDGEVTTADVDFLLNEFAKTKYGDANLSGSVDFADFLILSTFFGEAGGWANGDFNGDNSVTFEDLLILSQNFGGAPAPSQTVPEPMGLPVIGCFFALLLLLRKAAPSHEFRRTYAFALRANSNVSNN